MDKKYSAICFCAQDYMKPRDYMGRIEVDMDKMYNDISDFIRIAIHNGHQMKIWDDGLTVCIEYNYKDGNMSGVSLEWLGEDEYVETCTQSDDESEQQPCE